MIAEEPKNVNPSLLRMRMKNIFVNMRRLYKKHIQGTKREQPIADDRSYICNLSKEHVKIAGLKSNKVYVSSYCVKHLYDKRVACDFFTIVDNIHNILKFPDRICKNKPGLKKRGDVAFIKYIHDRDYVCMLESDKENGVTCIATAHPLEDRQATKFEPILVLSDKKSPTMATLVGSNS